MVAIGGAGPMTAFNVARKVGIEEVICPFGAGVGSSIGLTQAPRLYEASSTRRATLAELNEEVMIEEFRSLYQQAENTLVRAGANPSNLEVELSLDMRHVNQGHEIEVSLPDTSIEDVTVERAHEQFQRTYQRLFNRDILDLPIEIINYRVEAAEPTTALAGRRITQTESVEKEPTVRSAFFSGHGNVDTDVYQWPALSSGTSLDGPVIIEADQCTVVADPDSRVTVEEGTDLRIMQN
jgi:N-methylhydantoinase A